MAQSSRARRLFLLWPWLWLACSAPDGGQAAKAADDPALDEGDSGDGYDSGEPDSGEPDSGNTDSGDSSDSGELNAAIGMDAPSFDLVDLNPSSATHGETVSAPEGTYALIFFDSRCGTCNEVAVDLWELYVDHPDWWTALPTYAVQRQGVADGEWADTVAGFVEGHAMPYLYDTAESDLWTAYAALNHDFFAVSAEGVVFAWLPLYAWPTDLVLFTDFMAEQVGE